MEASDAIGSITYDTGGKLPVDTVGKLPVADPVSGTRCAIETGAAQRTSTSANEGMESAGTLTISMGIEVEAAGCIADMTDVVGPGGCHIPSPVAMAVASANPACSSSSMSRTTYPVDSCTAGWRKPLGADNAAGGASLVSYLSSMCVATCTCGIFSVGER